MNSLIDKYNIPGPRYTSYPTVPYWDENSFTPELWKQSVIRTFKESNAEEGISIYIHLPFCEALCTFCACHKRITKQHSVEIPYLESVLKEWQLYLKLFNEKPKLKELHLGGGTPTFFSPKNLKTLLEGIFETVEIAEHQEFSFEGHPNNTTKETPSDFVRFRIQKSKLWRSGLRSESAESDQQNPVFRKSERSDGMGERNRLQRNQSRFGVRTSASDLGSDGKHHPQNDGTKTGSIGILFLRARSVGERCRTKRF